MPYLQSPDGAEITFVDDSRVAHYIARGAKLAERPVPPDEPGLEKPLIDPIDIAVMGPSLVRGGLAIGSAEARAAGAGVRVVGKGATGLAERVAGAPVVRRLPGIEMFRGITEDVKGMLHPPLAAPAAEVVSLPGSALSRIKPLRSNASEAARQAHRVELESAMSEAKLDAQARRAVRESMGHGKLAPRGNVAGSIEPGPTGPTATKLGSAESRIAKPRHEVQYFSKAKDTHVDIESMHPDELRAAASELSSKNPRRGSVALRQLEAVRKELEYKTAESIKTYPSASRGEIPIKSMNQAHIEQAYRKVAATNPKPGSYEQRLLDALLDEAKHRLTTKGIQIGQASVREAPTSKARIP